MKRGNCLLGLVALWARGVRGRVVARPSLGGSVSHLMIRGRDGWLYHFRRDRDLLPGPLRYLWFAGRLVRQRRVFTTHYEPLDP